MKSKIINLYSKVKPVLVVIALFSVIHFIFDEISTGWFKSGTINWVSICATFLIFNLFYERKS